MTKFEIALELTEKDYTSKVLDAAVALNPSTTRKAEALWAAENALAELGTESDLASYVDSAYGLLKSNRI